MIGDEEFKFILDDDHLDDEFEEIDKVDTEPDSDEQLSYASIANELANNDLVIQDKAYWVS